MTIFHYKQYTFKLDKNTLKQLKILKKKTGLTWNLLFHNLIDQYGKNGLVKVSNNSAKRSKQNNQLADVCSGSLQGVSIIWPLQINDIQTSKKKHKLP